MIPEKLFEIGGEGGSIRISRVTTAGKTKFIYHHNEFDPADEGSDVNIKDIFDDFETAFQRIHDRYPWHCLYLLMVHDDYKNFVAEKLVEKLNREAAYTEYFQKERFEELLGIKFIYSQKEQLWGLDKLPVS